MAKQMTYRNGKPTSSQLALDKVAEAQLLLAVFVRFSKQQDHQLADDQLGLAIKALTEARKQNAQYL